MFFYAFLVLARDSYMVLKFNIMKTKAYVDCILHQTGNQKIKLYIPSSKVQMQFAQGGRGHWTVYFISPQSFEITFSYSFQPLISIYRRVVFVFHHWVCTLYINLSVIALSLWIPEFAPFSGYILLLHIKVYLKQPYKWGKGGQGGWQKN